MIENEFVMFIASVIIGVLLGLGIVCVWIWRTVAQFEAELRTTIREAIKEVEAQMIGLFVEQDGDEIFCYTEKGREFVCQGSTVKEIRERFNQRYPDKFAYIAGGEPELVKNLQQQLKALRDENSIGV
jgi:hypothetical protein